METTSKLAEAAPNSAGHARKIDRNQTIAITPSVDIAQIRSKPHRCWSKCVQIWSHCGAIWNKSGLVEQDLDASTKSSAGFATKSSSIERGRGRVRRRIDAMIFFPLQRCCHVPHMSPPFYCHLAARHRRWATSGSKPLKATTLHVSRTCRNFEDQLACYPDMSSWERRKPNATTTQPIHTLIRSPLL